MRRHPDFKAYLALISVCFFWGTTYLGIRMALESFPPFALVSIRFLLSGSIMLAAVVWRGAVLPTGRDLRNACLSGVLILGIGNGALVFAELKIPSGLAGLFITISPFWLVGLEALLPGGQRLHWPTIFGMLIGLCGAALLVAPDDALVQAAARLLRAAGFWGFAQMQFLTARRGPAIIDVNPRLYGSLPLATAAGINLPAVWHAVALGEPVGDTSYRAGVSYRWLEGELAAAAKGAWRELLRRPPAPRSGAMWAADDPLPSTLLALGSAWRRTGRKLAIAR